MKDLLTKIKADIGKIFPDDPIKKLYLEDSINAFLLRGVNKVDEVLESLNESGTDKAKVYINLLEPLLKDHPKSKPVPDKKNNTGNLIYMDIDGIVPHPVAEGFFPEEAEQVEAMFQYLNENGLDAMNHFPPLLLCTDSDSDTPRQWGGFQRIAAYKKAGIKGKVAVQIRHFENDDAIIEGMVLEDLTRRQDNAVATLKSYEHLFEKESKAANARQGIKQDETSGRKRPDVGKAVEVIAKKTGKSEYFVKTVRKILKDEKLKQAGLSGEKDLKELFRIVNSRPEPTPSETEATQQKEEHKPSTPEVNVDEPEEEKATDHKSDNDSSASLEVTSAVLSNYLDTNNNESQVKKNIPASIPAFFRNIPDEIFELKNDILTIYLDKCDSDVKEMILQSIKKREVK